jgi:putative ATP-binding cassette transporter
LHLGDEDSAFGIQEECLTAVLKLAALQHLPLHSADDWSRRLSPGEQQRLAMARALLIQPPLLFLDEATSGLDEMAERRLYEALAATDITVVSIGHRESLVGYHTCVMDVVPAPLPSLPKPIPSTTLEF